MSKQTDIGNFIEKTSAFKTMASWKKAANEVDVTALNPDRLPNDAKAQLDQLYKVNLIGNQKSIVIITIQRQKVKTVDKEGKVLDREQLVYSGELQNKDKRGVPWKAEFTVGKYQEPVVITNENQRYDKITGEPLLPEKIISGLKPVYDPEFEVPAEETKRKKFIDKIFEGTNTNTDSIVCYFNDLGPANQENKSDGTFSYEDIINCSYEELKKMSDRGGGSRRSGYYRDKDGRLRDKDDNLV